MIRFTLAAFLTSLLPLAPASAQPEDLRAAIDAYLAEDYRHIEIIARHAEDGVPEAIAVLGQAYLYGYGIEIDRPLGVALLEQAASLGERSSLVHLGRVFEFGVEGIPPDPKAAAKWYVQAAQGGDTTSAPAALKRLPADIVIAAGGAAWASEPAPDAPAAGAPATSSETPISAEKAPSPASAILGTATAPPPLIMNDKTRFPIFADTQLSPIGDAAASCFVVLRPEIERQKLALESLMTLNGAGVEARSGSRSSRYSELANTDRQLTAMSEALRASENLLADPARNGGLNAEAVRLALVPHRDALANRPDSGPGATFCGQRLIQLIGESAGWPER
ncbi:tetratricopeptide repeat protein [Henriciella aquimarina]|uniref:tetratricopeptide repeat protein n=1 Tax=Henriciella aquimarina TaxID=545261 RepID=UPI0009FBCB14|nr:tetratricopeptide repeat protein [Henriciella aquimarina]